MKTLLATIAALIAIGCANNPVQPAPPESATVIEQAADHITITGKVGDGKIRWDFPARDGSFKIQLDPPLSPYTEFYEYDVGASLFWYFEMKMLIVDDPHGYFSNSNYVLTLWR